MPVAPFRSKRLITMYLPDLKPTVLLGARDVSLLPATLPKGSNATSKMARTKPQLSKPTIERLSLEYGNQPPKGCNSCGKCSTRTLSRLKSSSGPIITVVSRNRPTLLLPNPDQLGRRGQKKREPYPPKELCPSRRLQLPALWKDSCLS